MGQKIKLQTLVHIFTKFWCILQNPSQLDPANNLQYRFITYLTTPKTCSYTTLQSNSFQK